MKKLLCVVAALMVFIIMILPAGLRAEDSSPVLAEIGGVKITQDDYDRQVQAYPEDIQKALRKREDLRKRLLKRIVQIKVLSDIAREKKIDQIPEVRERIKMTIDDLLTKEVLQREVMDKVKVTEEDMREYYRANKDAFGIPEKVKARHILIKVAKDASEDEKKAARKKAEEVLQKIKKGEDFASLAEKYSDDPGSARKGGDLGYFPRGRMVKPFEDAAFSLKPGEVSDIVETKFGYHIIKVEEKKPATRMRFEDVKDQIEKELKKKVQSEKIKEYVERMMEERKVKLYPERITMK